jgi:hypothetical protein
MGIYFSNKFIQGRAVKQSRKQQAKNVLLGSMMIASSSPWPVPLASLYWL